jgi:hypothetical protein
VIDDTLIFTPDDVDLSRSPLRRSLDAGHLCARRVQPRPDAAARRQSAADGARCRGADEPVVDGHARAIRWTPAGYVLDRYPLDGIEMDDPRTFRLRGPVPAPVRPDLAVLAVAGRDFG